MCVSHWCQHFKRERESGLHTILSKHLIAILSEFLTWTYYLTVVCSSHSCHSRALQVGYTIVAKLALGKKGKEVRNMHATGGQCANLEPFPIARATTEDSQLKLLHCMIRGACYCTEDHALPRGHKHWTSLNEPARQTVSNIKTLESLSRTAACVH